jgi:hypothetical protein
VRTQQHEVEEAPRPTSGVDSVPEEAERIMRTGALWLVGAMVTPAIGLGPMLAAGWRPSALPFDFAIAWWLGAIAAAGGLALLVWAGCPVLGFRLAQAYRQKVPSIRIGIVLNLSGMTLAGLAILLAPV